MREESETGDDGESTNENIKEKKKKGVARWRNSTEWRERESETDHREAGGEGREIDQGP